MKTSVIAAFLAICLSGCAATPVSQQTQRDYDGFSIVPPQEPGWFVDTTTDTSTRDRTIVRFQKKSGSDTHQMLVGVKRSTAPKAFGSNEEFLQYVNDSYFIIDPHLYEFLAKETKLNPKYGEFCVEYRYKYKDFKSPRPKSASFIVHEGHCFVCLHPSAKDREYDICYSEIFVPGEEDGQFRVAGEAFLDSIQFTEPSSAKPSARDLMSISAELLDNKNRVFILQQFPHEPLYSLKTVMDGETASKLSNGEVCTVKLEPGQHTIKASLGLMRGEKSFNLIRDKAIYFVIRERKPGLWTLISDIEILEVPEADWKYIAEDPSR